MLSSATAKLVTAGSTSSTGNSTAVITWWLSDQLLPVSPRGSFVSVGSKVYVFNDVDTLSIDCTSHTVQSIPDMPQRFSASPIPSKFCNVIDGKVYLIGDSYCHIAYGDGGWVNAWRKTVMVLDSETQKWEEPVMIKHDMRVGSIWSDSVVLEGKVYMKGKEGKKWESMDEVMNSKDWEVGCVVDDVLYYHDCSGKALKAFDPKEKSGWSVVNGLGEFLAVETAQSKWSNVVKCGEKKLALFFPKEHDGKNVICFGVDCSGKTPRWRDLG